MSTPPAVAFPPGDFLAEELEARHWTQGDFAAVLNRPSQFVSEIITGKKEITRESAAQIAAALGTSAEYWLNLQNAYQLWRQSEDDTAQAALDAVRRRARLNELAPVAELRKRSVLTGETLEDLEAEVRHLFGLRDITEAPEFVAAARRTNTTQDVTPTQKAWLACVRRAASGLPVAPFDATALEALAARTSQLLKDPAEFAGLQERYAQAGVRLVYVPALAGSRLDGASYLAEDGAPTIGLSGRGHRLDKVMFVLLHEVAHIVRGHVTADATFIDEGDYGDHPNEREANELAANWALPRGVASVPEQARKIHLQAEAERNGVHPVVVLGHLQFTGRIAWNSALGRGAPTATSQLASWNSVPVGEWARGVK